MLKDNRIEHRRPVGRVAIGADAGRRTHILRRATEEFASYLSEVTDGDLSAPTPCPAWSIEDLCLHMLAMNADVGGVAPEITGARRFPETELRESVYRRVVRPAIARLAAEPRWERYLADTLIHTWDLAQSMGFDYDAPDEETLSIALSAMRRVPSTERGPGKPYDGVPDFPISSTVEEILLLSGRLPA